MALWALPLMVLGGGGAYAQSYPVKPVQLVVPFPPGGATDIVGRLVAQKLGERMGQPVVVENRGGAGTIIGASYVAKAAPDGYTLLISSGSTFTVNPAINPHLPYDAVKSFEPIALVAQVPLLLVANAQVPVNNITQLITAVRAEPGKYVYGSFGTGTTGHFAGEQLLSATGLAMQHVPYKGSTPAITDLIGGQIPFSIDTIAATLPHIKSGKLKAIAVTGAKRSSLLPNVPTVAESGYPDFDADSWLAVVAPRGIPDEAKKRLEKALAEAMAEPEVKDKLLANGLAPSYAPAATVVGLIDRDLPRMRAIAQRANIRAD
ncbi:tripartite tricarboxylate transporter substrate binding protein [Xylophilus sp. GW821-FHT01B05]